MEDLPSFVTEYKEIVVAIIAGIFGVIVAIIRRPPREHTAKKPFPVMLIASVLSLLIGGGLLAAEYFKFNLDPDGELSLQNPGAILSLAGCMFVAAGLIWTPLNLLHLLRPAATKFPDAAPGPFASH